MGLNKSKGNMYGFVTHTWNAIKGKCSHDCSYCYMKRWGKQNPVRLDRKEFKTQLGNGRFIFVGSSTDVFSADIPDEWIAETLAHCAKYDNRYLFQTKNPARLLDWISPLSEINAVICTTIETNRRYDYIMNNCPSPQERAASMSQIDLPRYVTIEPIIDFDLDELVEIIRMCQPEQVNIGADSGNNGLPEPSDKNIMALIGELKTFTTISQKKNLKRLTALKKSVSVPAK